MTRRFVSLALAPLLALLVAAPAAAEGDRSLDKPYKPNPRLTLERYHLKGVKPLTAEKAERIVEGEERLNLPLQEAAKSWDDVGFSLDPGAVPDMSQDDYTGEVRAVPVNLGLGFVRPFQRALMRAGYYLNGLVDGYYGVMTASELRRFQKAHGLPPTGWADRATVAKLNALTGSSLDTGAGESFAIAVKSSLRYLGYHGGKVNGQFDRAAQAAVADFQVKNEVKSGGMYGGKFKIVRGWVDKATAERINEMVRRKKSGE